MKKPVIFSLITLTLSLSILSSCSQAQQKTEAISRSASGKEILIVYLSRTNNTKAVAEMIKARQGGDLISLELMNAYPADYKKTVEQVEKENKTGYLPPLKTKIENIGKYDIIFIGFPTWGMQLPPPMKSFLKQYDLKGKTIIPFNTNAGYGIGNSFDTIRGLAPASKVMEGLSVEGGKERDGILFVMKDEKQIQVKAEVEKWLDKLKLNLL